MRLVKKRAGEAALLNAVEVAQEKVELPLQCVKSIGTVMQRIASVQKAIADTRFDSSLFFTGIEEYASAENKRSAAATLRRYYTSTRRSLERLSEALVNLRGAIQEYSRACGDQSPMQHMFPRLLEFDAKYARELIEELDKAYSERADGEREFKLRKALDRYDYDIRNITSTLGMNVVGLAVRRRR